MRSRALRIGLGVGISVLLLGLAVRDVNWGEAFAALRAAHYLYVVPMLMVTVWGLYVRSQRWRLFLRPLGTPPLWSLIHATNIGFMANMLLPLRIGEVIRPVLVNRREHLPLSGLLASIVLERIFDMFTVLLLFGVSALLVPVSDQVRQWGKALTGVAALVAAVIVLIRWQERPALALIRRICALLPAKFGEAAYGFAQGFVKALEILDSPLAFLKAFLWSVYLWVVITMTYVLGVIAFDLQPPAFTMGLVVTTVVAIAVSVPSAPGYIGAFQLGCVLGLAIFAVPESKAIAYSIVLHLTQFVGIVAAGLYSLWAQNMSLREIESVQKGDERLA